VAAAAASHWPARADSGHNPGGRLCVAAPRVEKKGAAQGAICTPGAAAPTHSTTTILGQHAWLQLQPAIGQYARAPPPPGPGMPSDEQRLSTEPDAEPAAPHHAGQQRR
jgi:hypothetical protein